MTWAILESSFAIFLARCIEEKKINIALADRHKKKKGNYMGGYCSGQFFRYHGKADKMPSELELGRCVRMKE